MKRTWLLSDEVDERLHELKQNKKFTSMDKLIRYLLDSYENQEQNFTNSDINIKEIDKNIQILMEMVAWQCDKTDTIPSISISKGFSDAYNNSKKLVQENIEKSTKLKREQEIL